MDIPAAEPSMHITDRTADALVAVVDRTAAELRSLDDAVVRSRPAPDRWSIKEIVGHLVDSACNNHQRFVRARDTDALVFPRYYQDAWVAAQGYNESDWPELVELWRLYNHHIAQVIRRIPQEKLEMTCTIEPFDPVTLGFLVTDYLDHLKHHLRQIDERRADR